MSAAGTADRPAIPGSRPGTTCATATPRAGSCPRRICGAPSSPGRSWCRPKRPAPPNSPCTPTLARRPAAAGVERRRSRRWPTPTRGRTGPTFSASATAWRRPPTLEAAFLSLFRGSVSGIPPLFLQMLTQLVVRAAMEERRRRLHPPRRRDPVPPAARRHPPGRAPAGRRGMAGKPRWRRRPRDGGPVAGRSRRAAARGGGGGAVRSERRRLRPRSDAHDLALDIAEGRPGQHGLARALERLIAHLLGEDVAIRPAAVIEDPDWRWHVGLDTEATAITNDLWNGEAVEQARLARILWLGKLRLRRHLARAAAGARQAGLPGARHGRGAAGPVQAAEPGRRPAPPAEGVRRVTASLQVPGTVRIPVAVLAERRPGATPWAEWSWRAVEVLEEAPPDLPPWTVLREEAGRTLFLAGRAEVELHPDRHRQLPRQPASRSAAHLGGAARSGRSARPSPVHGHGGRRRSAPLRRCRHRPPGIPRHARRIAEHGGGLCRPAPRRARLPQAPPRPRRSGRRRARRGQAPPRDGGRGLSEEDGEGFLSRWSRRKRAAEERAAIPSGRRARASRGRAASAGTATPRLRSREPAAAGKPDRGKRLRRLSARGGAGRAAAGGPAAGLDAGPRHPRLRRPGRLRLGLQRARWRHARLLPELGGDVKRLIAQAIGLEEAPMEEKPDEAPPPTALAGIAAPAVDSPPLLSQPQAPPPDEPALDRAPTRRSPWLNLRRPAGGTEARSPLDEMNSRRFFPVKLHRQECGTVSGEGANQRPRPRGKAEGGNGRGTGWAG